MAEQAEKKNTYISLHKNFVRTDIEYTDPKTGEKKTFNSVTLPQGTIIDGKDVVENEEMIQYPEIWSKIHAKLANYGFIQPLLSETEFPDQLIMNYFPDRFLRYIGQ